MRCQVELQTGTAGLRPAFSGWCASIVAFGVLGGSASAGSSVAVAGDSALLLYIAFADLFLHLFNFRSFRDFTTTAS